MNQTLFGSELFYLTEKHHLAVSAHIWILLVVSGVLTAVTLIGWRRSRIRHEHAWKAHMLRRKGTIDAEKSSGDAMV